MRRLITPLLDVDEMARLLRVKRSTLYKWACYNRIPYVKIRRRLMFHRQTVEEWVERQNPPRIESAAGNDVAAVLSLYKKSKHRVK